MNDTDTEVKRTATICNRRGLHARAAAKFVKLVATFDAQIHVAHRGTEVSGMSIMGLMMLAADPRLLDRHPRIRPRRRPGRRCHLSADRPQVRRRRLTGTAAP